MNKIRIIGFVLFIAGVILMLTLENDMIDFISGLLIGAGIGLLVTGRLKRSSK
jgi:hypothetical protein